MMLRANADATLRNFALKRNAKAQAMYNGVIAVINKFDPEPDMALYVATLVYQQIMRDTCARAGIR